MDNEQDRIEKVVEDLASSEADFMGWANKLIQPEITAQASK